MSDEMTGLSLIVKKGTIINIGKDIKLKFYKNYDKSGNLRVLIDAPRELGINRDKTHAESAALSWCMIEDKD